MIFLLVVLKATAHTPLNRLLCVSYSVYARQSSIDAPTDTPQTTHCLPLSRAQFAGMSVEEVKKRGADLFQAKDLAGAQVCVCVCCL